MLVHGTAVARGDDALLFLGAAGSGKSGLALAMLDRGFILVADDGVELADGRACAPAPLAGLIEVRGLGLLHVPFRVSARVALALALDKPPARLPERPDHLGAIPLLAFDAQAPGAPLRAELSLDCALGRRRLAAGAWAS